ncbi:MAG: hypothetical protein L6W00_03080 [Lentisphaeria bacterium]|nr:MAG: hypothetical protein L6W00_03080 [Lentisphaeria bacterium]
MASILLNLLMALGAIWVLARMTPAIEEILSRNGQSLEACEEMFAVLAEAPADPAGGAGFRDNFRQALLRAEANVTEKEEPQALEVIRRNYPAAFLGNGAAREATVAAIRLLAASNRRAMIEAEARARHLGTAGAWGVVFMALTVFVVGAAVQAGSLSQSGRPAGGGGQCPRRPAQWGPDAPLQHHRYASRRPAGAWRHQRRARSAAVGRPGSGSAGTPTLSGEFFLVAEDGGRVFLLVGLDPVDHHAGGGLADLFEFKSLEVVEEGIFEEGDAAFEALRREAPATRRGGRRRGANCRVRRSPGCVRGQGVKR